MEENILFTSEMFEDAEAYWKKKLAGDLLELNLPGDYPHPGQYVKAGYQMVIDDQTANELIRISKNNNLLLNVILLSAFKVMLFRFTGQDDIIVSTSALKKSSQGYNKCIALRDTLSPEMTFRQLLKTVKETAADGYKYQYFPIRKLIKLLKIENRKSLFKFIFLLENIHDNQFLEDIENNGRNDIVFSVNKSDDGLQAQINYNSKLFKEETIQRLGQYYIRIINCAISDTNIKLADIDIITGEERKQLLQDFNSSHSSYPREQLLHQLFEQQAAEKKDDIVISQLDHIFPEGILNTSYEELNEKAHRFALQLREKGAVAGSIIALMVGHSTDLMVGLLGILKAGCIYLPLDPDYPADRINYILKDSSARMLVIDAQLTGKSEQIKFDGQVIEIRDGYIDGLDSANIDLSQLSPLDVQTTADDPAYIIYTSGSTGKPKGVVVEHRNVVRLVKNSNFIQFSPQDRMLPTGAIAFDISTFELWGPLLNGVRIYFVEEETILDVEELTIVINENNINILHLIPQLFNQTAVQKIELFAGLKYLLVGGDLVKPRYVNELRETYPALNILHMYGPTENTTFTTFFPVDKSYDVNIPIGKPVANSTVYILDRFNHPQPIGIAGELCSGGDGVARGYVNSPQLTAEKFIADPFNDGYLYKTGDLARWLPDGNIEFIGRIDKQVKIRGFRIEPGEVEAAMVSHEKVEEAVIVIKTDEEGTPYLCAYFTAARDIEINQLRQFLALTLPDYMIPLFFVKMEQMPLTPNGKIDRNALPEPEMKADDEYVAPRNDLEKQLVDIWADVLRVNKAAIGIDSNFFQLGGHSLNATHLSFSIHKEFGTKITLNRIFESPTIRELAPHLKDTAQQAYATIEPTDILDSYELSSAQKRIYISQQIDPENTAYNMPVLVELHDEVDSPALENAFRQLIRRHESFRTSFHMEAGEPVQRIHDHVDFKVDYLELSDANKSSRPFDLAQAPLLRASVLSTPGMRSFLFVDMHHIISDGTSIKIFEKEFTALYSGRELAPLKLQYKDFSQWQNHAHAGDGIAAQETYWLKRFEGPMPVLDLPLDYERGEKPQGEVGTKNFQLNQEITTQLTRLANNSDTSLYILLMTIYNILFYLVGSRPDIVVGIPIAGRRHPDLENIIGMFVNMLPLRSFPDDDMTFADFLQDVKNNTLEAYENQDYPFDDLVAKLAVDRSLDRNQLIDVVFNYDNIITATASTSRADEFQEAEDVRVDTRAMFDLQLNAMEINETLTFSLVYSAAIFKASTIDQMVDYYITIARQVIKNADIKLKDIVISHGLLVAGTVPEAPDEFEF